MLLQFITFLVLCFSTVLGAVILTMVIYRIKGGNPGLRGFSNEIILALTCAAVQAGILWVIWKLYPEGSWFPYLLCVAVAIMFYKGGHGDDMEMAGPFVVAAIQLLLFVPANQLLRPVYSAIEKAMGAG